MLVLMTPLPEERNHNDYRSVQPPDFPVSQLVHDTLHQGFFPQKNALTAPEGRGLGITLVAAESPETQGAV
jgi:hypothetical protein